MSVEKKNQFFLGGHDLEMIEIAKLLRQHGKSFYDKKLSWGAKASAYESEIKLAVEQGANVALIELENDLPARVLPTKQLIIIDHHGEKAGKDAPTSLEQVATHLNLNPSDLSRWQQLVSANDRGYIPAMKQLSASHKEITAIRAADRRAQGITPEQERLSRHAVKNRKEFPNLTVVETTLQTSSAISDFLQPELAGPGYKNLLVFLPDKASFYGSGQVVLNLASQFNNSWYGGNLPESGFWGCELSNETQRDKIFDAVRDGIDCCGW